MLALACVICTVLALGFLFEVVVGSSSGSFDAQLGFDGGDLRVTRMTTREFLGRPAALLLAALTLALAVAGQPAAYAPAILAALLFLAAPRRNNNAGAES